MIKDALSYITQKNIVVTLILLLVGVGIANVFAGDLELAALAKLLGIPVAGLAAGAGLSTIQFTKAAPGEPILGIAILLVLAYAIAGAVQVLTNDLEFPEYVKLIDLPVAGLAVGKGLFANNSHT